MSFVNKNLRNSGPWKPTYDHKNNLNTQNAFLKRGIWKTYSGEIFDENTPTGIKMEN